MDFQEGYCDGLAGEPPQRPECRSVRQHLEYVRGYALGALDCIAMTDDAFARWMEGLA